MLGDTMGIDTRYINQLEVVINLFAIENGVIKILLVKKEEEPFKNYWYLPSNLLMVNETIDECASYTIFEFTNFENVPLKQCNIFSKIDRLPGDRIIADSLIGIISSLDLKSHEYKKNIECRWFPIDDIPKTVYDHGMIIEDAVKLLKKEIKNNNLVNLFLEDDFTLPELQSVYESAYNKKLDRRNFRKYMLLNDKIVDSGKNIKGQNGRPPKLYHFNENKVEMF